VIPEARRARAAFALSDASGTVTRSGEEEAAIEDDALRVGPVTISFLDADGLRAADYRIELDLWPGGRLVLTQIGRRFETFARELRRARNQARVAGLLAHGITMPEVFPGALLTPEGPRAAEFQVFETHVTVVPEEGDPWQVPLGALTAVRHQDDPPGLVLETAASATVLGLLGRQREACHAAIVERRESQRRFLAELTGQPGFSDGQGVARGEVKGFERLLARFTAPARASGCAELLAAATADPRLGFVQLLDPDGERLESPDGLPPDWAAFLLVPDGALTVLEILAGPSAATYVFRGEIEALNRDLQTLHFRRAPLALTPEQAVVTPDNPHRLALRKLEPLRRLRSCTVSRVVHSDGWSRSLQAALK
jgi:hypothetical protein